MRAFLVPRPLRISAALVLGAAATVIALSVSVSQAQAALAVPFCVQHPQLCTENNNPLSYNGWNYTAGHDEPSLLFYSNAPGSGNSNSYQLTLPTDPAVAPAPDGTGGTWSFMLHPAFWFGMAMCDDQSAPLPGKACTPDSDSNIYTNTNPKSPQYMGLTPGSAFMEMQFYPPGWGNVGQGVSCGPNNVQWCAAMTIDSFAQNANTGITNNPACLNAAGEEYVNYAIITKSGISQGPADPLRQNLATFSTGPDTLEMNSGDQLTVDMHDTPAGFQVVIHDLTTGENGSMTASVANGFGHPLYQPTSSTCNDQAYAFHPMYSTSTSSTRVLWAAHSYNVAFSDEVGHFEYCNTVTADGNCVGYPNPTDSIWDGDDFPCFSLPVIDSSGTTLINPFGGCLGSDNDFDGPEYQTGNWPGSGGTATKVTTPIQFSSPLFTGPGSSGLRNYSQVAFENDLPRIEGTDFSTNNDCQRHVSNPADPNPGSGCVNPPNGASFYPIYTTTTTNGSCLWQEGGGSIPGTTNNFGGTSTAEYGGLLLLKYPVAGPSISQRYNDFQNALNTNPCPAR